ncbi:MAG TPA: NAD(P)-dependent oxidoreductase [Parafilimonas sp.]|nr:NAD(P)-dependent oxidoreductase [Parafilimonas sp.]
MLVIGLIREGKIPADNRVALTPSQCRWLIKNVGCRILVQPSDKRCYDDKEYEQSGAVLTDDLSEAGLLLGIKEVPVDMLIPGKTYMFFSHTKKMQPSNQKLMHAMVEKKITLIDYECLEHDDGQRIIGFGFFAGIVGAHNGIMAYGERTGKFKLGRVYKQKDYIELIHTYFGLILPPIKIAVTGSGRVAHGILEIMNLMDVQEVEPDEYVSKEFSYPVYVHLKGADLYTHKEKRTYTRNDFHAKPQEYECLFDAYYPQTDILMNGVYWDKGIPRLFEPDDIKTENFRIQTIADITDDVNGSIPINSGDCSIDSPVYGVDRATGKRTAPYLKDGIDIMAVGNLPNELPRDASRFFGEQLIKHVLSDFVKGSSIIEKATILKQGRLTANFEYLEGYAAKA